MFSFGGGSSKQLVPPPEPEVTPVEASDLAFILDDASFWLESITILVFSRDGSFTNISFAVASLPFNKHQVLFTIKWHDIKCKEHTFQNKYKMVDLDWHDERCSVVFPDGGFIRYNSAAKQYSLKMIHPDIPKAADGSAGEFNMLVTANCGDGLKLGDGKYHYDSAKTQFWKFVWYPRCDVEASGIGEDWGGLGFVGRTTSNVPIYNLSTSAAHFKLITDNQMLTMLYIRLPKQWNGAIITVGAFVENGEVVAATTENDVIVSDWAATDAMSGYKPPLKYAFEWKGATRDGLTFQARSEISPARLVNCINVLANVPQPLRWVVQKLVARPFLYFWLEPCSATVKIGDRPEMQITGQCLHEYHFVNPP